MRKSKLLILIIAVLLSSCKDFLDLQPEGQINDINFYKTENDFEKSIIGAYGSFKDLYNTDIFYIGELLSDNAEISISSSSVAEMEFDELSLTPSNTIIQSAWTKALYTISRCNVIVNRISAADINVDVKNRIIAEAKFMRAFSYFFMVQTFGRSPITDAEFRSPEEIVNADLSLKSGEAVYQKIEEDLTSAESLLPAALDTDRGRVSVGTVKALLGKVYLTQHKDNLAAQKLKEVIDSRHYSLVDDYKALFLKGNENLRESLFELKFISGANLGNSYAVLFTPASIGLLANGQQGSGRINPTLNLMNAYDAADKRKAASVGDVFPIPGGGTAYSRYGLKFVDLSNPNPRDGGINFIVLRYADVLLMYAEALTQLNQPVEAAPFINEVRARAGLAAVSGLEKPAMLQAIDKDRRLEFTFEAQRWYDLKRMGKTQETINAYFKEKGLNFTVADHEVVLPIPRREIEINPEIEQNEDYE